MTTGQKSLTKGSDGIGEKGLGGTEPRSRVAGSTRRHSKPKAATSRVLSHEQLSGMLTHLLGEAVKSGLDVVTGDAPGGIVIRVKGLRVCQNFSGRHLVPEKDIAKENGAMAYCKDHVPEP